ncbi:carbohydrate ABC transporter permease [Paenibacillus sp. PR3]|uniref:Carbohydrate ABC transporter permease n=1 Tax=Paenibacillus terricola TaxID=2763503 RepID=A0ABR8N2V2_9BACL|nr:carbohydrate ABC transporter permease [Paenibacillus terricola]MBD3921540.1 carbohydrate ABC transporter permease [Paenibacillus terricola]
MTRKRRNLIIVEIVLLVIACLFVYPFLLVVINSLKPYAEVMTDVIALPKAWEFENYKQVWQLMDYPKLFGNTLFVTVVSIAGIVLFGSMAAYKLVRTKSWLSTLLFFVCIAPMMLPFQSFMITLIKLSKNLHLMNSLPGLTFIYWGLGCPLAVFLFHGFIKSIPFELEESATIDGCSPYRTFFSIIFPIMKPVTATVVILNVMWIWNDFLLPLIMLNGNQATLQLAAYQFFGQYKSEWQFALAAVVLTTLPPVIFFLIMQKNIMKGMVAGAVKG